MKRHRICAAIATGLIALASSATPPEWPDTVESSRPWTYWWWMGSAVDESNIDWNLDRFAEAGLGGVHVIPIYGVKGEESRFIDFLSPRWMSMLHHAVSSATERGLGVDMSTGTGWPFGGPQVTPDTMASKAAIVALSLKAGQRHDGPIADKPVVAVTAYGPGGAILDLSERVMDDSALDWTAPDGEWNVYAMIVEPTGQQVKRAAPGATGHVVDPFSADAVRDYVEPYDAAFAGDAPLPRGQYHDSYEYYGANWTDALFDRFEAMQGYDIRDHLAALHGDGDESAVAAVRHDYRATMAALLEEYIAAWVDWAHGYDFTTRNQAHGSPGNLLDLYAEADIPETEIFGPSGFPIPGLRTLPDVPNGAKPNPLIMKFASSAAHVTGKPLVSSETCTWMAEHFQEALSQAKPQVDELFVGGINHIFYHGIAYSPKDAAWPGWLFYASTNFGPTSPFFHDFRPFNDYVARCQAVLREGRPDNDILLYWPVHDVWQESATEAWIRQLSVHDIEWIEAGGFGEAARVLWTRGYAFDYVSDAILEEAAAANGHIDVPGGTYRAIVLPDCTYLTVDVAERLLDLAEQGATVITIGDTEKRVPGYGNRTARQQSLDAITARLQWREISPDVSEARAGDGVVLQGTKIEALLGSAGITRESMVDDGLEYIRRKTDDGRVYFITNLGARNVDGWISVAGACQSAAIMDPYHQDRVGRAATGLNVDGTAKVYLQLAPGQACVLMTYAHPIEGPDWIYVKPTASQDIDGSWQLAFVEGGPELPDAAQLDAAASWTTLDDNAAKEFSGTARYSTTFDVPSVGAADEWLLDLGEVRESARVRVNGSDAGTLFSLPFQIRIGDYIKEGENTLDIEVTSTAANRIAALDRAGVDWKKFHDINYVNINYKPFDASAWEPMPSGLIGPVRLIALEQYNP